MAEQKAAVLSQKTPGAQWIWCRGQSWGWFLLLWPCLCDNSHKHTLYISVESRGEILFTYICTTIMELTEPANQSRRKLPISEQLHGLKCKCMHSGDHPPDGIRWRTYQPANRHTHTWMPHTSQSKLKQRDAESLRETSARVLFPLKTQALHWPPVTSQSRHEPTFHPATIKAGNGIKI